MFNLSIALLLLLYPADAYAYIDPGAGSGIIQVLIASMVAGLFGLKVFWQKFIARVKKK